MRTQSFAVVSLFWEGLRNETPAEDSGQVIVLFAVLLPVLVLVAFLFVDIQSITRSAASLEYIASEVARCEALAEVNPAAPRPCYATTGGAPADNVL